MDFVDFTIALTQAARMGTEDILLPDGRGAHGRMTADATEESRSGGESRTQSRRRLEAQAACTAGGQQSAMLLPLRNISTVSRSEPNTMFLIVSTGCPALAPLYVEDPSVAAA